MEPMPDDSDVPRAFDSERLHDMKSNHPHGEVIHFHFKDTNYYFDPLSIDWEEERIAFSRNQHVKILMIGGLAEHYLYCTNNQEERVRNAKAFYRAVAANRSCKHLQIVGNITYGLEMKDTVALLRPFIQNNDNLCSLELGDITLDARTAQILASALSQCAGPLSTFGLKRIENLTGRVMEKIINALKLKSNIKYLSLDKNDINDDVAAVLGDSLATLSLKTLSIEGDYFQSISPAGMEAISEGISQNSTLESLFFQKLHIGVEGGLSLAEAVSNNSSLILKELDLICAVNSGNVELSRESWVLFFDLLSNSSLHTLKLRGNNIEDDVIPSMAACLNSMTSLTTVVPGINDSGWANLFSLLKNNTSLQKCETHGLDIGTDAIVAISNTLCDRTSIDSVLCSNHTLFNIQSLCIHYSPFQSYVTVHPF